MLRLNMIPVLLPSMHFIFGAAKALLGHVFGSWSEGRQIEWRFIE